MKTDRLEKFIKANRAEFDPEPPSPEVWEKIKRNTQKSGRLQIVPMLLKIAAVVAIVLVTAAVLIETNILPTGNYAQISNDPELRELIEAESFYANQVDSKMKEIRKCYYTFPELKQEIEGDLTELEQMYNVLKKDLRENVSNKMVIEAMIENNRYRLKLVDDVLEQINC